MHNPNPVRTKILIIEDDASVRETLVDMLELNGYQTAVACDGSAGLAALKREMPSLVITDVAMPGLTGFELLKRLREDAALRTVPVIVISASHERAATRCGMELGADDFITKPFTEAEVIHSITARLEKKDLLDELDAFAHTVAHDLRNPLCALMGRLHLLADMIGNTETAMLHSQVVEAQKAARRLSDIFDDLIVLSGVKRREVAPEPLDMGAIVKEALDRLETQLRRSSASLRTPPQWPAAAGHGPWITQVWVNYISNALKYGGEPPVIELGAEEIPNSGRVRFWVSDQGPGLDKAAQEKMFVPFTRISTIRVSGHGLGLSIVRRIIEKLEGRVGVDSEPGKGARFWFELPAAGTAKTETK